MNYERCMMSRVGEGVFFILYRTALEIFNFFVSLELKVSRSRRYNSIIQRNFISIVFLAVEYKKNLPWWGDNEMIVIDE